MQTNVSDTVGSRAGTWFRQYCYYIFGEPISCYYYADAIEDGFLVDVSETAREAGITFPVAITRTAYDRYIKPDPMPECQDERGRLWDAISMLRFAILRSGATDRITYRVIFVMDGNGDLRDNERKHRMGGSPARLVTLKAICGPGDDAEPMITIMMPDED